MSWTLKCPTKMVADFESLPTIAGHFHSSKQVLRFTLEDTEWSGQVTSYGTAMWGVPRKRAVSLVVVQILVKLMTKLTKLRLAAMARPLLRVADLKDVNRPWPGCNLKLRSDSAVLLQKCFRSKFYSGTWHEDWSIWTGAVWKLSLL